MSDLSAAHLFQLHGQVAVVTGGGTGIGWMAAKALASNGAKVYVVGRRMEVLEQAAKQYTTMTAVQCDITSSDSLKRLVDAIKEKRIDILVNNAGIEGPVTKIHKEDSDINGTEIGKAHLDNESFVQWDRLFRINTHSIFFTTMTLLPLLDQSKSACVTNITSISGLIKWSQNHYAYNASKAAANALTSMMAYELNFNARLGIRVNALAPGLFESEMTKEMLQGGLSILNPAGRVGTEREMASAILFLATNTFVTGQILAVDGGFVTA